MFIRARTPGNEALVQRLCQGLAPGVSHPTIGGVWEWESTMAEMESEDNRTCHIRVRKGRGPAGRTGALLDRLTHHTHILEMNGESYRLKRSRESAGSQPSEEPDAA